MDKLSLNQFHRRFGLNILTACVLGTLAGAAQAAFTVEEGPRNRATASGGAAASATAAPRPSASKGEYFQILGAKTTARRSAISQVGLPDDSIQVVVGFGKDMPFATGLSQIVPKGWQGYAEDPQLKSIGTISWEGGRRPWITVLNEVLIENGLVATVNWDSKEIMFGVDPTASAPRAAASGGRSASPDSAAGRERWVLQSGKTLRTNLEEWTKRAGWTLSWGPEDIDYNITASVEIQGDLVGDNGAITKVIQSYASAGRPLMVRYYNGNYVVRIEERTNTRTVMGR